MKRKIYLILTLLSAFTLLGVGSVQAQTYTCLGHYYGCSYNNGATLRYAAINGIEILADGVSVWKKNGDGCNSSPASFTNGHYNVMSTTPSFTLVAGTTYEVKYDLVNPLGTNSGSFIAFLDLDGDGNYQNVAGEHISDGWSSINRPTAQTHSEFFTIPCSGLKAGTSRIRFRSEYASNLLNTANEHSTSEAYGETEEYTITLANPTSIVSTFNMPDTAFKGTFAKATYTGNGGKSWWYFDNGSKVDGTVYSPLPTGSTGTFDVKNVSENCFGRDSLVKKLVVINPPALAIPDFVSDVNKVQLYSDIQLYDLSDNGPTDWKWHLFDTTQNFPIHLYTSDRTGGTDQNPIFTFYEAGTYTVCLSGFNIYGWSGEVCKKDYLEVTPFSEFDVSASWGTPIQLKSGKLYDKGGEFSNYEANASKFTNFLSVIPCNADKIDLTFTQFSMADDNDLVFVFDGTSVNGKPLHPAGGFKSSEWKSKVPFKVTAESGAFFIYYESNGSGQAEGFVANWVSTDGTGNPPIAKFEIPDVIYNGVQNTFKNTSQNVGGTATYDWRIDGVGFSFDESPENIFYTDGTYNVCLYVETCLGNDTFCKSVKVETPKVPTNTDFTATNYRPVIDEVIQFNVTNDIANNFEWSINPTDFVYTNGTSSTSKEPQVKFDKSGCYTISLTAWNDRNPVATSKTVVKSDFICVVDYCTPSVNYVTTDISINNVLVKDNGVAIANNSSSASQTGYEDFTELMDIPMLMGQNYDLEVRRNTSSDPWNGKVWIDWNIDGDFDDAGETIHTEGASASTMFATTVSVPDYTVAFEGKSRMRIGVGYKNDAPGTCGPINIGEYEDYTISIVKDKDLPIITLIGNDTVVMERNAKYVELGYKAIDPSQGDITSAVKVTTDLDTSVTGYYTMNYMVCDNSGNCSDPISRTVKVVLDLSAPVLTLGNTNVNVNVNDQRACLGSVNTNTFDYETSIGFTAIDAEDGDITSFVQYDNTIVDMNTVGTYEILFSVQDIQNNTSTAKAIVNVVDVLAPTIIQNGPTNIDLGSIWVEQTIACDKYDANPVLTATPDSKGLPNANVRGTYVVKYTATDASNNVSTEVVRTYRVDDFHAPTIMLHTADTIYHDVNETYYPATPSVVDNYFEPNEVSLTKTGKVIEYELGTYMETYTATDPLNNKSTKTRYVKVVDREAPQITGNNLNVPLGIEFWNRHGLVISDNYYDPADLLDAVEIVTSNVNVHVEGSYSITYQVTDPSGNKSAYYTRIVNVGKDFKQTIGINDIDLDKQITVYPIPTYNGVVELNFKDLNSRNVNATVVNSLGAEVKNLGVVKSGQKVDLTSLSSGVYFLRFNVEDKTVLKKIILN